MFDGVGHDGRDRCRRLVRPDRVERVVFAGGQHAAGLLGRRAQGPGLALAVQPGVVAQRAAFGQRPFDPLAGRLVGDVARLEGGHVDLLADLEGVAAVDEDRRAVGQHDGHAGGAGEAGQPGQALGPRRQELVLVLVGMGDNETVEAAARQFRPQSRQAGIVIGRGLVPGRQLRLEGGELALQRLARRLGHQAHPGLGVGPARGRQDPGHQVAKGRRVVGAAAVGQQAVQGLVAPVVRSVARHRAWLLSACPAHSGRS